MKAALTPRVIAAALVLAAGVALRLWAGTWGLTYDMKSYVIVARVAQAGGNVYAETHRYNYGPVWFHVLAELREVSGWFRPTGRNFRVTVTVFLTLVDIGLFSLLWRRLGPWPSTFFFLSPVTVFISGFHRQFDNLAILAAFAAAPFLRDDAEGSASSPRFWVGLVLLGLSLMTKHIFFLFPLWLALRPAGLERRATALVVPVAVFFLGFVPYWGSGAGGIIDNVFLYRGEVSAPFLRPFWPEAGPARDLAAQAVWLGGLCAAGWLCRQRPVFESMLVYLFTMVVFSPSMANQYLSIVIPAVSAAMNVFFGLFTLVAAGHFWIDRNGLAHAPPAWLAGVTREDLYAVMVWLLAAGGLWRLRGARALRSLIGENSAP